MSLLIDIKGLHVGRKTPFIMDVNCSADRGALVILTGVNGCGKSTLLKTIASLIQPLKGHISVMGTETGSLSASESARLIAYASTSRIQEDYVTVREMVTFGRFPFGRAIWNGKDSDAHVQEAMKLMRIEHIADKYLSAVSDGEWQKANVSRVLAQNTPVILMDEPTAFMDYPSKLQLFTDIRKIALERQKAVIMSTHDIEMAARFGTQFWHIDRQRLAESSQPIPWHIPAQQ